MILLSIVIVFTLIFFTKFFLIKYQEKEIKSIVTTTQDAINQRNPEKCKEVSDEKIQNACYVVVANATNDFSICGRISFIPYPEYAYSCYTRAALTNNDEAYCRKIESLVRGHELNNTYYHTRLNPAKCFTALAVQRKDNSTCEKIYVFPGNPRLLDKTNCFYSVSSLSDTD